MKFDTKKLTVSAIMIALSTVLSLITIWKMPLGGSITLLSMLPVCMISLIYGCKQGVETAFVYALGQLAIDISAALSWGLTAASLIGTIFLDYLIPFTFLGLAGMFRNRGKIGMIAGVITVITFRFICHFISGGIIFDIWCETDNVWLYSLSYNGTFMLPELLITAIGAFILLSIKPINDLINKNK